MSARNVWGAPMTEVEIDEEIAREVLEDMFANVDLLGFALRVVQEALAAGRPAYWLRRAAEFEAARPKPGDYLGQASPAEIAAQDQRLAEIAEACRNHATIVREALL